jgi:hypothetical protein
MDEETKNILKLIGLEFNASNDIEEQLIIREMLLSDSKYDLVKSYIPELKKNYSSSFMTSLQNNADKSQKWPLLNLTRQILNVYGYKMEPIRKADGYTLEGVKKYKRYFRIYKKNFQADNVETKKIEIKNINDFEDKFSNEEF